MQKNQNKFAPVDTSWYNFVPVTFCQQTLFFGFSFLSEATILILSTMATSTSARFLSRKRKEMYERIIRVNLAGEMGADRIYWGQMAVLGKDPKVWIASLIKIAN